LTPVAPARLLAVKCRDKFCLARRFRVIFLFILRWQPLARPMLDCRGMTKIAYNVSRKSHIFNTALVPANHSEEARFGPIDGAVIIFFLLCVAGFICFVVA